MRIIKEEVVLHTIPSRVETLISAQINNEIRLNH